MKFSTESILLLATTNQHKAKEITDLLVRNLKTTPLNYRTFKDYQQFPKIAETGTTFLENAKLKAIETMDFFTTDSRESKLWGVLSDDSGLVVPSLDGAPGVHSARYAHSDPNIPEIEQSAANRKKLLKALANFTTPEERRASFFTTLVLAYKKSTTTTPQNLTIHHFTGQVDGWIAYEERGTEGFGYDSLFIPNLSQSIKPSSPTKHLETSHSELLLSGRTFAQMSSAEKNSCSHRQHALLQLKVFFQELFSN